MNEEERDFDFICRWCGVELACARGSFSDPTVWTEQWFHHSRNVTTSEDCLDASGRRTGTSAEPTRWAVAL